MGLLRRSAPRHDNWKEIRPPPSENLALASGVEVALVFNFAVSNPAASSATSAPVPRKLSLGVIFLTLYIDLIGFSVFFPLGPELFKHYLANESAGGLFAALIRPLESIAVGTPAGGMAVAALFAGVLGSVYAFMQFIFSPIWGSRSDRVGRRPVLILTVAGNAFGYLVFAFGDSFTLFLLSRIIGGIMGGNLAVAIAAVADVTSRENRAKGMGIVGAAFGLGFLTGPLIGGLTANINLLERWPQFAGVGVHRFTLPALIAFGLCLINLLWIGLRFRETLSLADRGEGATFRERNPLHALFQLPDAVIRRTNLIGFLVVFGFSFFETTISFFTADRLGFGPRQLTGIFVYLGIISILTQGMLVRRAVPKLGEKAVALLGIALMGCGFLALGAGVGIARSIPFMYVALTLCALGSGFANVGLSALISLYAAATEQGKVTGIYRSLGFLARAISPVIAGFLFFRLGGTLTFAIAAAVLMAPLSLGVALPRPVK
jgi:MFS family permease